jgi:hypothetical protein
VHAFMRGSCLLLQDLAHASNSAYVPWDNYSAEVVHPLYWPDGYQRHIRGHACYDPDKARSCHSLPLPACSTRTATEHQPWSPQGLHCLVHAEVGQCLQDHTRMHGASAALVRLACTACGRGWLALSTLCMHGYRTWSSRT